MKKEVLLLVFGIILISSVLSVSAGTYSNPDPYEFCVAEADYAPYFTTTSDPTATINIGIKWQGNVPILQAYDTPGCSRGLKEEPACWTDNGESNFGPQVWGDLTLGPKKDTGFCWYGYEDGTADDRWSLRNDSAGFSIVQIHNENGIQPSTACMGGTKHENKEINDPVLLPIIADCLVDGDADGVTLRDGDCDDDDGNNFPGNPESCDGVTNDCDPNIDEGALCPAGQVCSDGACQTTDECTSASDCLDIAGDKKVPSCVDDGTGKKVCQNITIVCANDAHCPVDALGGDLFCDASDGDVVQNFTNYTCSNPGTATGSCTSINETQVNRICQGGCENGACLSPSLYWTDIDDNQGISLIRFSQGEEAIVGLFFQNADAKGFAVGEEVNFSLYEMDGGIDDGGIDNKDNYFKSIIGVVDESGNSKVNWTITETELTAIDDLEDLENFYFRVDSDLSFFSNELTINITEIDFCSLVLECQDYGDDEDACVDDENECEVGSDSVESGEKNTGFCSSPGVSCGCWWDEDEEEGEQCQPDWDVTDNDPDNPLRIGNCSYNENAAGDDCSDRFLTYSWAGTWSWDDSNDGSACITPLPSDEVKWTDGNCYYDPSNHSGKCADGQATVKCPERVELPFFTFINFIVALIAIALIYLIKNED